MQYWVGVTNNKWFDFLSQERPDEVNFWQPSGKPPFKGLPPGTPFLFKLKSPNNHIGGGGYFVKFETYPISWAWDAFGKKNGAASLPEMERLIGKRANETIGCTILTAPFFWPRMQWLKDPAGWKGPIQTGRKYDTQTSEGISLWNQVQGNEYVPGIAAHPSAPRYGEPVLQQLRLGQGAFRVLVTDAYHRRCAITGESTLPVLEAAHILPYAEDGPHEIANGLLLRSDFHKLFDIGLVTVTPELIVEISPKIREEWFNGKAYYRLHGQQLMNIPSEASQQPAKEFLSWHNENRYQG